MCSLLPTFPLVVSDMHMPKAPKYYTVSDTTNTSSVIANFRTQLSFNFGP